MKGGVSVLIIRLLFRFLAFLLASGFLDCGHSTAHCLGVVWYLMVIFSFLCVNQKAENEQDFLSRCWNQWKETGTLKSCSDRQSPTCRRQVGSGPYLHLLLLKCMKLFHLAIMSSESNGISLPLLRWLVIQPGADIVKWDECMDRPAGQAESQTNLLTTLNTIIYPIQTMVILINGSCTMAEHESCYAIGLIIPTKAFYAACRLYYGFRISQDDSVQELIASD